MAGTITHKNYKIVPDSEAQDFAWIFTAKDKPMQKVGVIFPDVLPHEIRIKINYAGLCHSDLHTVREEWGECDYPMAPGHEITGNVTHVGSDVKDYKVGDKVGFGVQRDACGQCEHCKDGFEQLCDDVDHKFTYDDMYWGGYATSLQHPAAFFFKIPDNLPEASVPPLFCAGVTVFAPIARFAKAGTNVAVLGIGGLGHLAVRYLNAWGCNVTAFTSSPNKEEFIKKLGAHKVVVTSPETLKENENQFAFIINTLPDAKNFNEYVLMTKKRGTFVSVGLPNQDTPLVFDAEVIVTNHINVTGSLIGSRQEIRDMLEFSSKHDIVPLCEEFDFEDFPKAFDKLENGRPIFRCVVNATKANLKH